MILQEINLRFQSGNAIPVERAWLKADEWRAIHDLLITLAYPDLSKINTPLGSMHHAGIALEAESVGKLVRETVGLPPTVEARHEG